MERAEKPNIIYLLSDQHNYSIAGFMGDPYVKTPHLDCLAEKGVVLQNGYCNSPLCVPSRSSMLTGCLPIRTGIFNNMQMLPSDKVTVAHAMANAGYETVLAGRMHFLGYDQKHGFEKRLVGDITTSYPGVDNEQRMYGPLKGASYQARVAIERAGKGCSSVLKFDAGVTDAACEFLENREDKRPLFMIVGFYSPHCPYVAYEKWYDYYYETLPVKNPSDFNIQELHPAMQKWISIRKVGDVTEEELRKVRAAYYAMVSIMDENVGQILETVKDTIGTDNTVIIYGSDHGDCLGSHGLYWKTNFYEGSARIPMIFSYKGHFQENFRLKTPIGLVDLAPTLLEIGGAKPLPDMDGMSILNNFKTGEEPLERPVVAFLEDNKGDNPSAMLRLGRYKLIMHYGYEIPQMFDMEEDPEEEHDLGADSSYAETIRALQKELLRWWSPEKARKHWELAAQEYEILKEWVGWAGWEPLMEWPAEPGDNYIL